MRIKMKYFASIRQIIGKEETEVEVPEGSTVGELVEMLMVQYTDLKNRNLLVAVNGEYACSEDELDYGDVVAMFPPVSGG